ncbi:homocysteine S-methyltransferase family protein [Anaerospora hongkongensis]|uniref:homocysteine S-methyltransferase family protein n=1 Tax=Anaerospora hongkongensis TaxID=244830 RepID=UPI00289F4420|nr:homocysteine S-methyltransferase family protein [Anaerospora hongkongensis]
MIHIFDGAMGTMLQQAGLPLGYCPELYNIDQPEIITAIHRQYIASGATIIETNTFGANRIKLQHFGLTDKVSELNKSAVQAARLACGPHTKIAGSVGPTGKFIAPIGNLSFDEAYDVFYEQICALAEAGVDYILIETIIDIQEMRAALLAAKAATNKPVICQLSYGSDGRTVTGTDPQTATIILEAMGASVIGANCSLGPAQLLPIAEIIAKTTSLPISIQANAGMPELINGQTVFPMSAVQMADWIPRLLAAGVSYIGGCCGTTPDHIKAIRQAVDSCAAALPERQIPAYTALTSRSKTVFLGPSFPTAVIGERINPTGRKALAADIKEGQYISVKKEAIGQVRAGAKILDVNMGVPGIDQAAAMTQAIKELSMLVDVPLAIDTTDTAALEAGLKAYPGRALINSVSAEPERLESFLPLAKKYGAAVLCLPIAPGGVPQTAQERLAVIHTIVEAAFAAGLRPNDLLLDALVLTVAAEKQAALETLDTLRLYRQHFGYPTVMGLSNISYGLPRRDLMNAAFCAMSLAAGLDAPILNPYDPMMQDIVTTAQALLGHDKSGKHYSTVFGAAPPSAPAKAAENTGSLLDQIRIAVEDGEKEAVVPLVRQALAEGQNALDITDNALTAAMNNIGAAYGAGRCYLPQVMLAAESMRAAFLTIKEILPAHSTASRGKVVLATVKGDIHDLGKNIVAALLENNGFTVIDLGKDVDAQTIVEAAYSNQAHIVGLCALMTTTMPQIDSTIKALKDAGLSTKTIVGGAVLTQEYAAKAGADTYASDGVAAVAIAKRLMEETTR